MTPALNQTEEEKTAGSWEGVREVWRRGGEERGRGWLGVGEVTGRAPAAALCSGVGEGWI
jgi:hypothetical protein